MSKRIRRTVIITLTETWTYIWSPDDHPASHPAILIQHQPITEEEANENLQATLDAANASQPPVSQPAPTSDSTASHGPGQEPANRKGKRPRQRRIKR